MKITMEELEKIAKIALLELQEDKDKLLADMNILLDHVKKIEDADTTRVEPTINVMELSNITRPDEVKPSLPQADVLKNAPEVEDGQYKVPRII